MTCIIKSDTAFLFLSFGFYSLIDWIDSVSTFIFSLLLSLLSLCQNCICFYFFPSCSFFFFRILLFVCFCFSFFLPSYISISFSIFLSYFLFVYNFYAFSFLYLPLFLLSFFFFLKNKQKTQKTLLSFFIQSFIHSFISFQRFVLFCGKNPFSHFHIIVAFFIFFSHYNQNILLYIWLDSSRTFPGVFLIFNFLLPPLTTHWKNTTNYTNQCILESNSTARPDLRLPWLLFLTCLCKAHVHVTKGENSNYKREDTHRDWLRSWIVNGSIDTNKTIRWYTCQIWQPTYVVRSFIYSMVVEFEIFKGPIDIKRNKVHLCISSINYL